jgi:putative oxidoreductase
MIKESHLEIVRTHGSKFGRVLIGLLFLVSGLLMLTVQGPAAVGGYFASLGIPMAGLVAWAVIVLKIVAGGAIVIGKRTTEAAAALIIFTLIATLLGHMSVETDPMFPIGLLKNLAIVGGLLYLMAFGPHGMNIIGDDPWEKTGETK